MLQMSSTGTTLREQREPLGRVTELLRHRIRPHGNATCAGFQTRHLLSVIPAFRGAWSSSTEAFSTIDASASLSVERRLNLRLGKFVNPCFPHDTAALY